MNLGLTAALTSFVTLPGCSNLNAAQLHSLMSEQHLRERLDRKIPTGTPRADVIDYLDDAGLKYHVVPGRAPASTDYTEDPAKAKHVSGNSASAPAWPTSTHDMILAVLEQPWWKLSFMVWKETYVFFRFTSDDRLSDIDFREYWAAP